VKEEVRKHVDELRERADVCAHQARVYEILKLLYAEYTSLLKRLAAAEERYDKILWEGEK